MRLLIVEDNDQLAELLAQGLKAGGFETDRAALLTEAQDALSVHSYAGVVLDRGLPDGDGEQLVTELRAKGDATPVLMLTARGAVAEKVRGLSSGADDYLFNRLYEPNGLRDEGRISLSACQLNQGQARVRP